MNKEQALNLIKQVVEAYRGTLQEHQALQQAFQVISKEQEPQNEKAKKDEKTK